MKEKWYFRGVELVVVLTSAGLLLASLGAVGRTARERSKRAICLANQGYLVRGWHLFTEENDGYIPVGFVNETLFLDWKNAIATGQKSYPLWSNPPHDENLIYLGSKSGPVPTLEDRKMGCRTGAIYPYIKNAEVYHCPSDRRLYEGTTEGDSEIFHAFRSYSLPNGLMGQNDIYNSTYPFQAGDIIKKFNTLTKPESKYCFLDAPYNLPSSINYNYDGWGFEPVIDLYRWWFPLAVYHDNGCTMAFSDGHAAYYKFQDERSIQYHTDRSGTGPSAEMPGNVDIDWFVWHYPINRPY